MKNIVLLISIMAIFIATSNRCNNTKHDIRDKIVFNASVKEIEDNIIKMNSLLNKLETSPKGVVNYFFDNEGYFYLNNKIVGKIDSISVDSVQILKNFSSQEKKDFIRLIYFLKSNYLSSTFMDKPCRCYLYDYRAVVDKSYSMNRYIYIQEQGKNYETLFAERRVLDKKGSLVLIGAKE